MPTNETFFQSLPDSPLGPDGNYDREVVERVWNFAQPVRGNDQEVWRKDEFGAWIHRLEYGNRNSQFGWEIIDNSASRKALGLATLRPCQWQNYLDFQIASSSPQITARGLNNGRQLC